LHKNGSDYCQRGDPVNADQRRAFIAYVPTPSTIDDGECRSWSAIVGVVTDGRR
jgi:hypothetical protein